MSKIVAIKGTQFCLYILGVVELGIVRFLVIALRPCEIFVWEERKGKKG